MLLPSRPRASITLMLLCLMLLWSAPAWAFCGFYVSGATGELSNGATQVVLMRHGKTTVQSMQNSYEGPPQDFAMVVPVPVVLQKDQVNTLNPGIFKKIDQLGAPRLVEYWEQDPCTVPDPSKPKEPKIKIISGDAGGGGGGKSDRLDVTVEAQFEVGEYEIVVLSAKESNGLETWLKQNKYNIPKGAAKALKPYIQQGMYFFVAKVNLKKLQRDSAGRYTLSPLRFHYQSDEFSLPVRLGLLNAKGKQDLIVHILAKNQRYEVANAPNVTIPTNIIVHDRTRTRFGQLYATLFDRVTEENPGAVVTEYAWDASTCDPCPGPTLGMDDYVTLGADVTHKPGEVTKSRSSILWGWTLTRLHARYDAKTLRDDLVFKKAKPLIGGRGIPQGLKGRVGEQTGKPSDYNNFQGRYIILNRWKGKLACKTPRRGVWGGPPAGQDRTIQPATNLAFIGRARSLKPFVKQARVPGLKSLTSKKKR